MKKIYPNETLKGNRIVLKRITPEMSDEIYEVIDNSRESISEFLTNFKTIKLEDEKAYLQVLFEKWENASGFTYAIYIDRKAAGTVALNKVDFIAKTTDIGYWMGKQFEGKGYMSEAVNILINEAKRIGLKTLTISCAENNQKSANIARRLDFSLKEEYYNEKYNRKSYLFCKEL